ncbi:MAG: hypothetical protein M3Q56_01030 [Bacteroidota bacterium]|nr:hypothetical protein [Bacteroidota bacterium]
MKKLFFLIIPVLFVFACKNTEQFRAPIDALSADWEKTTTMVTEVGSMLTSAQSMVAGMKDSFMIDPKMKLTPAKTASLDSMKMAFNAQLDGLTGLANDFAAFTTAWAEKSAKVNALKEGLASGKLEGDVMAQVEALKKDVAEANTNAEAWRSKTLAAQQTAINAYGMYKENLMKK